uniref:aminotransferase class I/II-fold pyridoxal phosphate-dependent enzyme n=1 Tax=Dysosmobacter welbionis TaxID=2093857 RepID=UPI00307B3A32
MAVTTPGEGDEVLIQRPVYYPFADSIQQQKRVVVNSPLQLRDGRYEIDFADFERKAASPRCRAFVLSNPHNPVGRVYTEEELRRVGEICRRHHVFVIADEIHSDLIFPGHQHIVFASLGQNYAENCAVCHAPSKTFNLAGLSFSCIMIPNEERRKRFDQMFARYCRAHPNFFAPVAAKAAWDHGEAWLDSCLAYIQKNDQFVREFAEDTWNGDVKISPLEGTYLQWIDFRRLEPDAEKLRQKMLYQAHVAMDEGSMFGPEGNGFERLNLAAPRNLIEEIMDRIAAVLR